MQFDAMLPIGSLAEVPAFARRAEELAFDGVWTAEAAHDAFLPLMLAAEHTQRLQLGTSIAVAFARTPMTLAVVANDLQTYSRGRCVLGLGSQIRPHIESRYSMPWSRPAERMREFVQALRAIWHTWQTGERLKFRGEFYRHTLMTPMFDPGPNEFGPPQVHVAGVGPRMTEVAGEVADGFLVHPFTTARYLAERILPALERGLGVGGRKRNDLVVTFPGFTVELGRDEERRVRAVREQMAFYGSTPAYRPVLELHGWGALGDELNLLSKSTAPDKWQRMGDLVTDEMIAEFTVYAEPAGMRAAIEKRFGGLIDRFTLSPRAITA